MKHPDGEMLFPEEGRDAGEKLPHDAGHRGGPQAVPVVLGAPALSPGTWYRVRLFLSLQGLTHASCVCKSTVRAGVLKTGGEAAVAGSPGPVCISEPM